MDWNSSKERPPAALTRPPASGYWLHMTSGPEIICERRGAAGTILLNRPAALNALNLTMVRAIAKALNDWEHDAGVERVVISGAGDRAFCAGGDIRALYDQGRAGDYATGLTFWREEYLLNLRIKTYPKPYVALVNGIVMGGGVGVSLHGSHVVAGERFVFAMPEVGIGFFPDVGATYMLPRLLGLIGRWIALTGGRVKPGDAVALGVAQAYAPAAAMARLAQTLEGAGDTDAIIAAHAAPAPPSILLGERAVIDRCFAGASPSEVIARLRVVAASGSAFAKSAAEAMGRHSPTSLAIALRQMQVGGGLDFAAAMRTEFRIVSRLCRGHEFYEGIRAQIIDKDYQPHWRPARFEDISAADTEAYFAPLGADELPSRGQTA